MPVPSAVPESIHALIHALHQEGDPDRLAGCVATLGVEAQAAGNDNERELFGLLVELLRPSVADEQVQSDTLLAVRETLDGAFGDVESSEPEQALASVLQALAGLRNLRPGSTTEVGTASESRYFSSPPVLSADADPTLLPEALEEFLEHLELAEVSLLEIEDNPDDPELLATIFRSFHTLKGTSGFLGLDRIGRLAHLAENILSRARQGDIQIVGNYADLVLESCDQLRTMVQGLEGLEIGDPLIVPAGLESLLDSLIEAELRAAGAQRSESGQPAAPEPQTREGGDAAEDSPSSRVPEGLPPTQGATVAATHSEAPTPKRVPEPSAQKSRKAAAKAEASIRVNTGRLDNLVNMVGELVTSHAMIAQAADGEGEEERELQEQNIAQLGKITRELQGVSMALRMVPLKGCMDKVRRLVRELSKKSGKRVQFVSEGAETEIDRTMVEAINDPLVHMIRNSLDHGIETAEVRQAQGKPEIGTLTLRAYHAAGDVVIEIEDDGKGLDKERILAKAIERGLIESERGMSDGEVFSLIFRPGFSTAERVTDISGRGVGMDVVKRSIEVLRGRVDVASVAGEGTKITLRFPLTMAITDAMVVGVGDETYLLPTSAIQQSFRTQPETITDVVQSGEMVMFRGTLIPIVRLHRLFGIEGAKTELENGLLIAIEVHGQCCATLVDELHGQQQVVIKSLGAYLGSIGGFAGGTILGNGRVGLILDAKAVMELAHTAPDHTTTRPQVESRLVSTG